MRINKSPAKIRVLLVDDHPVVIDGIKATLGTLPDMRIVGTASDGPAAIARANELDPDVIVLDLSLPVINGIEVLRQIRGSNRRTRFVIYTIHESREFVTEAKLAGASAFLLKTEPPRALVRAIRNAFKHPASFNRPSGPEHTPASTLNYWRHGQAADEVRPGWVRYHLTRREAEVLRSLVDGLTFREIAARHAVSVNTIITHLRNIYAKLRVRKRSKAVAKALEERIV